MFNYLMWLVPTCAFTHVPAYDRPQLLLAAEWDLQTVAPLWNVRDVAAHLLDTVLRKLSMVRDACCVETARLDSPHDVIALVNRLNREGMTVYSRLSPRVSGTADTSKSAKHYRLIDAKVRFFADNLALVYGCESAGRRTNRGTEQPRCLIWTDTWLKRNGN